MPVNIYRVTPQGQQNERIAWLCVDNYRLPDLALALATWLVENRSTLKPDTYVVDIVFTPRLDAMGGGAALPPELLQTMADLGMSLFLSEYPAPMKIDKDYTQRGNLLPEGCKDLIDVFKPKAQLQPNLASKSPATLPPVIGELEIPDQMTVRELAPLLKKKPFQLIAALMEIGVFANVDQQLGFDVIARLVSRYGYLAKPPPSA